MNWIVGIHLGHDASVTLLRDGRPVFCLSEERLVREKGYFGFPFQALGAALAFGGLDPGDVDTVALDTAELPGLLGPSEMARRFKVGWRRSASGTVAKARHLFSFVLGGRHGAGLHDHGQEAREVLLENLSDLGFRRDRIRVYDHHHCHAASAFWPGPFDEALVVTSDGRGDGLSATLGWGDGTALRRHLAVDDASSIGQFYAAVTFFLGFRPNRHEGKILGLAARGDPEVLGPTFLRHVTWAPDGAYSFRLPLRYRIEGEGDVAEVVARLPLSWKDRVILHAQEQTHTLLYTLQWYAALAYLQDVAADARREDVAAGVQYLTEEVCTRFVEQALPDRDVPVVLAGGVFANVRVNQRIRELPRVSGLYVQPAMGDEGLSLGSALNAFVEAADGRAWTDAVRMHDAYLGPAFSEDEILGAAHAAGVTLQRLDDRSEQIAGWIHEGRIVGLFQGRLEFGPRALGHRSVLARATDADLPDRLNERLRRTDFMPFAPSVLAEYASAYLEGYDACDTASEYMTSTYSVRVGRRGAVPAVVHVDGTTRPHVVHKHREPFYHAILAAYYRRSGVPLVLNTSFNMHEEPIVCTPLDALRAFRAGSVDVLVIESFFIDRRDG